MRFELTSNDGRKVEVEAQGEQEAREKAMIALWGGKRFELPGIEPMPYYGDGLDCRELS